MPDDGKNARWDLIPGLLRSEGWREVVRIRRLLERESIPASFFYPAVSALLHPDEVRAVAEGTVVFPDATLKVFLTATVEARAERRHKQLIEKGFPANIATLSQELRARDQRDSERTASPLKPAEDAYQLDSSALTIEEVVAQVLDWYAKRDEG